jgi:hypothetical protein
MTSDNLSHGLGKTERVLATNSRIKKDELNRMKFYLKFVNNAFKRSQRYGTTSMVTHFYSQFCRGTLVNLTR